MQIDEELVDISTFNNIYKVDPMPGIPYLTTYDIVFVDSYRESDHEFKMLWDTAEERDLWFNRIYKFLCD